MRIISGKYRGRKIRLPKKLEARPTTDFAKEALFNILSTQFEMEELKVMDLYCGTGNMALEFCSRGVPQVIAVDQSPVAVKLVAQLKEEWNIEGLQTIRSRSLDFLKHAYGQFDLIFADPPYRSEEYQRLIERVFERNLLAPDGWLILEHDRHVNLDNEPHWSEKRTYGNVNFSIFRNKVN